MNNTPLQPVPDSPQSDMTTQAWVYPPLYAPPSREAGMSVVNHGSHQALGWQVGWAQAIGLKHRICEDSMALRFMPPAATEEFAGLVLSLGDGVGGGARGEVASNAIVRHCIRCVEDAPIDDLPPQCQLAQWLAKGDVVVNRALCQVAAHPGASTLAALWVNHQGNGWVTRVGDARACVLEMAPNNVDAPSPVLRQWLQDQTYKALGERPPHPCEDDAPARMVGAGLIGEPEVVPIQVQSGSVLLLSSDGLHNWVSQADITQVLSTDTSLDSAAKRLVTLAQEHGSDDDISILLARKD